MAPLPGARAPAAPAMTSTTPAPWPSGWASPHYVLDFEARFRAAVIDDFAEDYAAGAHPDPLRPLQRADQVPRPAGDRARPRRRCAGHRPLCPARDGQRMGPSCTAPPTRRKDQSYFLFATTADQLDFLRFPLGELDKAATRAHAVRFGLTVADKPDSQDICFVPTGRYSDVVGAAAPGRVRAGPDRPRRRPRARPPRRHGPFHRRPAPRPQRRRRRARST